MQRKFIFCFLNLKNLIKYIVNDLSTIKNFTLVFMTLSQVSVNLNDLHAVQTVSSLISTQVIVALDDFND